MSLLFVNDPQFDALPKVGEAPALLGPRTQSGEAVRWSKDGDPDALAAFLGDAFVSFEGRVWQRMNGGALEVVEWTGKDVVLVRPPAGNVFHIPKLDLVSLWAIVTAVDDPEPQPVDADGNLLPAPEQDAPSDVNGDGAITEYELLDYPALVQAVKDREGVELPFPAAKKAVLIGLLVADDEAKAAPPVTA